MGSRNRRSKKPSGGGVCGRSSPLAGVLANAKRHRSLIAKSIYAAVVGCVVFVVGTSATARKYVESQFGGVRWEQSLEVKNKIAIAEDARLSLDSVASALKRDVETMLANDQKRNVEERVRFCYGIVSRVLSYREVGMLPPEEVVPEQNKKDGKKLLSRLEEAQLNLLNALSLLETEFDNAEFIEEVEYRLKESFQKNGPAIRAACEDWDELSIAVAAYCVAVERFIEGEVSAKEVESAYDVAIRKLLRRKSGSVDPPLHKYVGDVNREYEKLRRF